MTWYVVRTRSNGERLAEKELRAAGLRVYLPKRRDEHRHRLKGGEVIVRYRPLFIGYLLVRFPEGACRDGRPRFDLVEQRPGPARWGYDAGSGTVYELPSEPIPHAHVVGLLTWRQDGQPVPIADAEVAGWKRRQRKRLYDAASIDRAERAALRGRIREGGRVRLLDGPFAGLEGRVEGIDGNAVRLLTEIFDGAGHMTAAIDNLLPLAESVGGA